MLIATQVLAKPDRQNGTVADEARMLELFAPINPKSDDTRAPTDIDNAFLWHSDALHRAKNLVQLTTSLAGLAEHPSRHWLPADIVAETRSLARAYQELSSGYGETQTVPCTPLLTEIATRLTRIFGRARGITISIDADPVALAPDMRRALVLMGSELIINSLKYAYPAETGGVISVRLKADLLGLALAVEDDGAGIVSGYTAGRGSDLLKQICCVLGASLTRRPGKAGRGYCVTAQMRTGKDRQCLMGSAP